MECFIMLIDTKIVKRLNFQFCKSNAIYLLVDYMELKTEIQNMQQRIPFLIDFMEWQYVHDYRIINQDGLNEYLSYLYSKKTFSYAEAICSYIRSFCKYLMDEGYCGFVSFSEKPRKSNQQSNDDDSQCEKDSSCETEINENETSDDANQNADESKDNTESEQREEEEKPRKRRGRPRKSESKESDATEDIVKEETPTNNGEKKRRGRPRKNKEAQQQECESNNSETNNNENTINNGEQKRRRGRPRKEEKQASESDVNKEVDATESEGSKEPTTDEGEKKRRGRPRKEENGLKRVTNYYEALGVQPDADLDQIKKAYRKKAFKIHPDLHPDDPLAYKKIEALHSIMSVLEDRVQRMVYDVAFGYLEYDEDMRFESPEPITWYTKRHYTVWM